MNLVTTLVELATWALLLAGSGFVLIGGVGMLRFPDAYTRMHATSITDTLGAGLILLGLMLQAGFTLMSVKLGFIMVFLLFTTPAATHAFAQTALRNGLIPITADPPAPDNADAP